MYLDESWDLALTSHWLTLSCSFNLSPLIYVSPQGSGFLEILTGIQLWMSIHDFSVTLLFFLPALSSDFPIYLSAALSKGQASFLIR